MNPYVRVKNAIRYHRLTFAIQGIRLIRDPEIFQRAMPKLFAPGARAIGTFQRKDLVARYRMTALRSLCRFFRLGQGQRFRHGVDVIHLVSCSPYALAFTFILYHSSRTRRARCSSLASFLLKISPSLPFSRPFVVYHTMLSDASSHIRLHHMYYPYRLIPFFRLTSNVLCRLVLVLEIEILTGMTVYVQRRGS